MSKPQPTAPIDFTSLRVLVHASSHHGVNAKSVGRIVALIEAGGITAGELEAARAVLAEARADAAASDARVAHFTADRDAVKGAGSFDLYGLLSDDVEYAKREAKTDRRLADTAQAVYDGLASRAVPILA